MGRSFQSYSSPPFGLLEHVVSLGLLGPELQPLHRLVTLRLGGRLGDRQPGNLFAKLLAFGLGGRIRIRPRFQLPLQTGQLGVRCERTLCSHVKLGNSARHTGTRCSGARLGFNGAEALHNAPEIGSRCRL